MRVSQGSAYHGGRDSVQHSVREGVHTDTAHQDIVGSLRRGPAPGHGDGYPSRPEAAGLGRHQSRKSLP